MSAKQKRWRDFMDWWHCFDREWLAKAFEKLAADFPDYHGRHSAEVIRWIRETSIRDESLIKKRMMLASKLDRFESGEFFQEANP